jgi:hypothetical protein
MEAMGIPDIPDCILMDFTQCLGLRWTICISSLSCERLESVMAGGWIGLRHGLCRAAQPQASRSFKLHYFPFIHFITNSPQTIFLTWKARPQAVS